MPWVKFTENFDWRDPRMMRRHQIFKAGEKRLVTTPCANAAIFVGKAYRVEKHSAKESENYGD